MKILCAGDLHMGRRSSRLPSGADAPLHSGTAAWNALVEHALAARVDLVALSGDVVDRDNRYFEAVGPLERGVRRLAEAGIPVAAVAGNHDFDVLPRLAPTLGKTFHLLGGGGRWSGMVVGRDPANAIRVAGWSFPAEHVRADPLAGFPAVPDDGVPLLALLHADLDAPASPYAPVASAALRAKPVSLWLLGHLHAPRLHTLPGAAPLLYPGSPQALDPGETGAHGAWMVELRRAHPPVATFLPLSTVRYDAVEIDAQGVDDPDALDRRVAEGVSAHLAGVAAEGCGPLRHLVCRLRVTGRTPLHRTLSERLGRAAADLEVPLGEVAARVERVEAATRPALDLAALARAGDAAGVLARLVLALDEGAPDAAQERLLADLAERVAQVRRAPAYLALGDAAPPAPEHLHALARRQALLLLDEIVARKEAA